MAENMVVAKINSLSGKMAEKYSMDPITFFNTFKATVFKSCKRPPTNEEVAMFMMLSMEYDLNPMLNQIYAFPAKNGAIIPVVGIDGFVTIMQRNKEFDGYEMFYSDKMVTMPGGKPCPEWCEIKIFKKNQSHPVIVREYLDEIYVAARSDFAGPWQTHTKRMERHKTITQGGRVAFSITGIYDEDEAQRINDAIDITHTKPVVTPALAIDPAKEVKDQNEPMCSDEKALKLAELIDKTGERNLWTEKIMDNYKVQLFIDLTDAQADEAMTELAEAITEKAVKENKTKEKEAEEKAK